MDIQSFAKEYGYKPSSTKSEFKKLPELLLPGEELKGIVEGVVSGMHKKSSGFGIIFSTNKRVVFYRKSLIGTETKEEYSLHKISSASSRKGLLSASIIVRVNNDEAIIENCSKKQAERFVSDLSKMLNAPINVNTNNNISAADEIKKLVELKNAGVLTDEEFQQQKQKLLL